MEGMQQFHNPSQRGLMGNRSGAVSSLRAQYGLHPVKLTVMLLALQGVKHFLHQIVNKQHLQLYGGVVDLDGQVVGDIMAECANCGVIIGAHPFSHQIGETVDQHPGSCFFSVGEKQVLSRFLGQPVLRCAEAPLKGGLYGGGKHDRRLVPVLF